MRVLPYLGRRTDQCWDNALAWYNGTRPPGQQPRNEQDQFPRARRV